MLLNFDGMKHHRFQVQVNHTNCKHHLKLNFHKHRIKISSFSLQVKIWFQNRRARERRDKESGQDGQDHHSKFSLHGAKSGKDTFIPKASNHLPSLDHLPQEGYQLKRIPETTDSRLPILKSPQQVTPPVPSYLLHGLLPSHLPWLRPTENPFLSQRTLGLFNG